MIKLSSIKANPKNPRVIKDEEFQRLCKSIEEFPKMMALRPMVVDDDMMVLGGNQRLKALQHLGYKEISEDWVKKTSDLTEEERRRFIIADNVSAGDWDMEGLITDWDVQELEQWGVNIPDWSKGHEVNNMTEDDLDMTEIFNPIGLASGLQRVVFIFENQDEAEAYLQKLGVTYIKRNLAWQVNLNTLYT